MCKVDLPELHISVRHLPGIRLAPGDMAGVSCCSVIICATFSCLPRSMLDAPLIVRLLILSDWNFPGTSEPPGTCCYPSATTAASTSAPYAPPSTTPAAPTTQGPPRAGGGKSCTSGSCTFAGEGLTPGTTCGFPLTSVTHLPFPGRKSHFVFLFGSRLKQISRRLRQEKETM